MEQKGLKHTCILSFTVNSCPSDGCHGSPSYQDTVPPERGCGATRGTAGPCWSPRSVLTLGGQVEADVPVILHGAVELAVTGLAEVEGSPAVQLLAVGVVAYLWARTGGGLWPDLCRAQGGVLAPQALPFISSHAFPTGAWCSGIHATNVSQALTLCHSEGCRETPPPAQQRSAQRQTSSKK